IIGLGMRHAEINQPRLFTAGNHFDGIAQYLPGTVNKLLPVTRGAQGIGGQYADPAAVHTLQKLRELAQTIQPALLGFFRQYPLLIQTSRQRSEEHTSELQSRE